MINKVDMLKTYIENNVSPILIEDVNIDTIGNIVRINADCEKTMLMGHYEETKYLPPVWFDEVVENSKKYKRTVLLIENINSISVEEQEKFYEILKYRKINTFRLPQNCLIVATYSEKNENLISEKIYTFFSQV